MDFKDWIRDVPDFPKEGIVFKDITPLLQSHEALTETIRCMAEPYLNTGIDYVCGIESRGFLFAPTMALQLKAGMIPLRKKGKLPWKTRGVEYDLEYGTDEIEIHQDGLKKGDKILMVDDLLATGGTMSAACKLVESLGGQITACVFLIELAFLKGREKLKFPIHSLIQY